MYKNQGKFKLLDKVNAETPIALIGDVDGEGVIIHSYGEILFKKCQDKDKMKRIAEKVFD